MSAIVLLRLVGFLQIGAAFAAAAEPTSIVGIKTEDERTVVLQVRMQAGELPAIDPAQFRIGDQKVEMVSRRSATIYEDRKGKGGEMDYPQILLHGFFLRIPQPLQEGRSYPITSPLGAGDLKFNARETLCEAIKFNQVGYNPAAHKRYAFYAPWFGDLSVADSPAPAN